MRYRAQRAIACFAGAATGTMPGTAGFRTGTTVPLATGTTTTASASFCPFSLVGKMDVLAVNSPVSCLA